MPDKSGTIEQIAIELVNMLENTASRLSSDMLLETFAEMGVLFPEDLLTKASFKSTIQGISNSAIALGPALKSLIKAISDEDVGKIVSEGLTIISNAGSLISSFNTLASELNSVGPTLPGITSGQVTALTTNFLRKFLDLLIVDQLDIIPAVGNTLTLLGIIEKTYHAGDEINPSKPAYEEIKIHYDRIFEFISSPVSYFKDIYDWGESSYDGTKLLQALHDFIVRFGIPAALILPSGGNPAKLESFAIDVLADTPAAPGGLEMKFLLPFGGSISRDISLPHEAWTLGFKAEGIFSASTTATLVPPFTFNAEPPTGQIQGKCMVELKGEPSSPFIILGQAGASRLEVGSIKSSVGLNFKWNSGSGKALLEPLVSADLKNGKVVIDSSEGDGFLNKILSGIKTEADFNLACFWGMDTGLRFEGSAAIEIAIPVHITLGPISISTIYIVGKFEDGKLSIEISASFGADLAVLAASVERLGMLINLSFPEGGGNLGPSQMDFKFKPPNGVGLALDVGIVKGGGYLYLDFDKEEYAGALEFVFADFITLKAIGLITTRMPDGSKGFSLLIIITVEFGQGLQLGYGFKLLGVGGLIGLNRTMKLEALIEGVRTGAVESIMFPSNVIENAPKIISDLRKFFPPEEGKFLIGPMAKIGWGTPTLISLSLGIIIEIPGNIAILVSCL